MNIKTFSKPYIELSPLTHTENKQQHSIQREGLPNIGFTCFLNSVLQFLYASTSFRADIENNSNKSEFQNSLAMIFDGISHGLPSQTKRQDLYKFVGKLRLISPEYHSYTQQDALKFLLLILNELQKSNQVLIKHFQVKYVQYCKCDQKPISFKEIIMFADQKWCVTCKSPFKTEIIEFPRYLILVNHSDQKFESSHPKHSQYKLSAKILYFGNGRSGHYTCSRKSGNGSFYTFNDDLVLKDQYLHGKALLILYEIDKLSSLQELNSAAKEKINKMNSETSQITNHATQMKAQLHTNCTISNIFKRLPSKISRQTNRELRIRQKNQKQSNQQQVQNFARNMTSNKYANYDQNKEWSKVLTIKSFCNRSEEVKICKDVYSANINVIKCVTLSNKIKFQKRRVIIQVFVYQYQNKYYYDIKIANSNNFFYWNRKAIILKAEMNEKIRWKPLLEILQRRLLDDAKANQIFSKDKTQFFRLDFESRLISQQKYRVCEIIDE